MLKYIKYPPTKTYHSDSEYPILKFYLDILPEIKTLDLELGYFSSGAISVLAIGMAQFIQNDGVLRIVTNESISEKDADLIFDDTHVSEKKPDYITDNTKLDELKRVLEQRENHFYNCLSFLKQNDRLIIQPVKPKGSGIAHNKIGLAYDGENKIYYSGSANFTGNALLNNAENIDVSLDWNEGIDTTNNKIRDFSERFEKLINKEHKNYTYLEKDELTNYIKDKGITKNLDELISDSLDLELTSREQFYSKNLSKEFKAKNDEFEEKIEKIKSTPRFPFPSGPREYQKEAYQAWVKNDYKGIFAMATGTGKTITALNCVLEGYKEKGVYKAVIIVPTIELIDQWKEECNRFNYRNIITVSSKTKWSDSLSFFNTASKYIDTSFIVVVTYASFHRKKFQDYFRELSNDTILIADETHNMGAGKVSEVLPTIHLKNRIGLSATPNRKYDEIGNKSIEAFFDDKPPYVYSFSMKKALDMGWLSKFKYYPHLVELDSEELRAYYEISQVLMKFFDSNTGTYKKDPVVEILLLKRKRIIHKAKSKLPKFKEILLSEYKKRGSLKYSLIYVPEGKYPDFDIDDDNSAKDEEDADLINKYTKEVSNVDFSIMVKQFTAKSKDRDKILSDFGIGNIDVLTSMKCLDEGVDVPRSELAIFCASTGNPRQFIQRRGRVLRLHPDKRIAIIHDLVVVPKADKDEGYYDMERNIVKRELERVVDFSALAINKIDTYIELEEVLDYYNLNLEKDN